MRKIADANEPSRKYLSDASWLSRRRCRAMPTRTYSGSESTSSPMNIVMRSPAAGRTIMPPTANRNSG